MPRDNWLLFASCWVRFGFRSEVAEHVFKVSFFDYLSSFLTQQLRLLCECTIYIHSHQFYVVHSLISGEGLCYRLEDFGLQPNRPKEPRCDGWPSRGVAGFARTLPYLAEMAACIFFARDCTKYFDIKWPSWPKRIQAFGIPLQTGSPLQFQPSTVSP